MSVSEISYELCRRVSATSDAPACFVCARMPDPRKAETAVVLFIFVRPASWCEEGHGVVMIKLRNAA